MIDFFESIFTKIDIILKWLITILFGSMAIIIFLQVISRYIFQSPLPWSEELARFLFIWITFIGGVMAARKGSHIGVEIVVNAFNNKGKKIIIFISSIITSFFFGLTFYLSVSVFDKMMVQTSPAMGLPIGYPYLGVIIGSLLMCLWYAVYAFKTIKGVKVGD